MSDYKVVIYVNDQVEAPTDNVRKKLFELFRDDAPDVGLGHGTISIASIEPVETPTGPDGKALR